MTNQETVTLHRAINLLDQLFPGLDTRRRNMLLRVRAQLEELLGEGKADPGRPQDSGLYSYEQWTWVAERYVEGYTAPELAAFLGLSASSVHAAISRLGVPRRGGRGRRPTPEETELPELEDRNREFYALV